MIQQRKNQEQRPNYVLALMKTELDMGQNEHGDWIWEQKNELSFPFSIKHESILVPILVPTTVFHAPNVGRHCSKDENTHQSKNQ